VSTNTQYVSEAFSKQSVVFDSLNEENKISRYLRGLFRKEVLSQLKPQSEILELNCGTGLDAVFFAQHGHRVLANDNAKGMLEQLQKKIEANSLEKQIETLHCSFHDVRSIKNRTFDHIISNFGGLNCTEHLDDVLKQFSPLLKPGGKVTLMIMPRICPWEIAWAFKGNFKLAFRRLKKKALARVEGVGFYCYYYGPSYVKRTLKNEFKTISLKGVCVTVPPEFMHQFAERKPERFERLKAIEEKISETYPFTHCCDHFLITLQKK
jgi:ubiquinone/menaquinone biosynthesis C-methylase UbiE